MPRTKAFANAGSAEVDATVARVAPVVLELLADGVPRTMAAVTQTLAGRHEREDVIVTLLRLAVTGQAEDAGGRYTLASEPAPDAG